MLGLAFLWRTWKERQRLSVELTRLSETREELQGSVTALRAEEQRLSTSNTELSSNVDQLERANSELAQTNERLLQTETEFRANVTQMRAQNIALTAETGKLRESISVMTVQNDQLLETTNKLRGVLKIAGQSSQNIVEVEKKLFSAIDDLAQLNQSMKRNNLEQRRRQLRDIFMKFDVNFESKIKDPKQVRRMIAYVRAVYDDKMEKLDDLLNFAAESSSPEAGGRTIDVDGGLQWDVFEATLLRDAFWQQAPLPEEHHLHAQPS